MIVGGLGWRMKLANLEPEFAEAVLRDHLRAGQFKRSPGRPRLQDGQDIDTRRAIVIEKMKAFPGLEERSDRDLICFANRLERAHGERIWRVLGASLRKGRMFDVRMRTLETLQSSVSNGRRKLRKIGAAPLAKAGCDKTSGRIEKS